MEFYWNKSLLFTEPTVENLLVRRMIKMIKKNSKTPKMIDPKIVSEYSKVS